MEEIKLVHFGKEFYWKSGIILSSIYKENPDGSLSRYDYGYMALDMEKGHSISVRQATEKEKADLLAKLENLGV